MLMSKECIHFFGPLCIYAAWTTLTNGRWRNATNLQIWKSTTDSRWRLQVTSLPEREVRNFRPLDSGWTERASETEPLTKSKLIHRYKSCCSEGQWSWSTSVAVPSISLQAGRASVPDSCPSPRPDVHNATPSLIKRNACRPLASGLTNGKKIIWYLCVMMNCRHCTSAVHCRLGQHDDTAPCWRRHTQHLRNYKNAYTY